MERGFDTNVREILKKSLPRHTRRGQGGTYTYHKGSDVIKCLNDAFGHSWSSERVEEKQVEEQILILVSLTVMSEAGDVVTHQGYGSADIARDRNTKKVVNIGNVYKSAFTNGLKKAAEQFGIGLEEDEDEEQVSPAANRSPSPPSSPSFTPPSGPMKASPTPMDPRPAMPRAPTTMPLRTAQGAAAPSLRTTAAASIGVAVSAPPENPAPMQTPDLGDQLVSDTQKKALRNLAKMKKRGDLELIQGALPGTEKTSFDKLLRREAIEVIKYAGTLAQG